MDIITYSLRADQPRSDQYYRDIASFTDAVLAQADSQVGALVAAFAGQARHEEPRTPPEYIFELLTLGVLWRVYGSRALNLARSPQRVLSTLARWRERGRLVKPLIDAARGSLFAVFLARNGLSRPAPDAPTPDHLERLLDWLVAAGDFKQEVERLRAWQTFFAAQPPHETARHLAVIMAFTDWFAARSLEVLGRYTPHVEPFLNEELPRRRWREDMIFCGRQRVEYHLNMVGTEILNRAFREDFLATQQKIVLVPPCMRAQPAEKCQASETPFGAQCVACTPGCHVHQVTKLGEKHGFAVFMLPEELAALSPGAGTQAAMAGLGIVGISCPLTNAQGGWKCKELAIPAQGMLLDYCGCVWHWRPHGAIPTDINFHELLRVMDVEKESVPGAETQQA
jgi:hypothetical protein